MGRAVGSWQRTEGVLDRLLNQSRTQATGAHADSFVGTINDRANCLDIGIKHPLGLVVRMTDVVPGRRLLLTEITHQGHSNAPSE